MSIETLKEDARRHEQNEERDKALVPYGLAIAKLDESERAVELYEKVFSLDINFADVTDRLRDLR